MTFPTTPLLDTFIRPDEDPIAGGPGWAGPIFTGDRQLRVATNLAAPHSVDGFGNSYVTAGTYGPDVEAYCTLASSFPASSRVIFFLRAIPGASDNWYAVQFVNSAGDFIITVSLDGVTIGTALDPEPNTMASGDSFGCQMLGNTVEVFWRIGLGPWTSWGTRVDVTSKHTVAGRIGLGLQGGTALRVTNFGGGTVNPLTAADNAPISIGGWGAC